MIWASVTGERFRILREENEWTWYQNIRTGQEYSCRTEAFRARFFPTPD